MAHGAGDTLDSWNPMAEDYEDKSFNSYDRGPGRNMPEDPKERSKYTNLYVRGVPSAVTEQGLRNLFERHGEIVSCRIRSTPNYSTHLAFIVMTTVEQCSECIRHLNGYKFGNDKLSVEFAKSKEEKERDRREKEEQDILIKSLGNGRTVTNITADESPCSTGDLRISIFQDSQDGRSNNGYTGDAGHRRHNLARSDHNNQLSKSSISTDAKACEQCGRAGSKYKCGNCYAMYCSPECQDRNWGVHKNVCNRRMLISPKASLDQTAANEDLAKISAGNISTPVCGASATGVPHSKQRATAGSQQAATDGISQQGIISKPIQHGATGSPKQAAVRGSTSATAPVSITLPINKPLKVTLVEFQSPSRFFVQLADNKDLALLKTALHQAVECSLYGVIPYKGNSWTDFSVQISSQLGLATGEQYSITCVDTTIGNQVMFSLPDGSDLGDRLIDATGALVDPQSKYHVWDSLHRYLNPADPVSMLVEESSVEGVDGFYAQIANGDLRSFILSFQDLESQQNIYAQSIGRNLAYKPSQGDCVLCNYEGSWCRGEIYQSNDENAVIGFVDYGNLAVKPVGELLPLPRQFSHLPAMAAKIHLDGITDSPETFVKAKATTTIKELLVQAGGLPVQATVKDLNMDTLSVQIIQADGTSLSSTLLSSGLAVKHEQALDGSFQVSPSHTILAADSSAVLVSPPKNKQHATSLTPTEQINHSSPQQKCKSPVAQAQPRTQPRAQHIQTPSKRVVVKPLLTTGEVYTVRLRKLDGTVRFCVNFPAETPRVFDSLCRDISGFYCRYNAPEITKPNVGDYVVFQSSRDEWRRGCVLKVSSANRVALTRHLDFEGEATKVPFNMLREMLPQFAEAPCQACPVCQLENITDPEIKVQILKPYMQLAVQMRVLKDNDGVYLVNMTHEGQPLKPSTADTKWMAGKNVPILKLPSGPLEVKILEVVSPLDIHITPVVEKDVSHCLKVVEEQGNKVMSESPPNVVEPGEVLLHFAEQYSEWDRVIVIDNLDDGKVSVKSADYGSIYTEYIHNMRLLTAEAANVPMRAVKCSLAGVGQTPTENACDYVKLLKERKVTAEVVQDSQDNVTCMINANGVDVNEAVKALMPDVASSPSIPPLIAHEQQASAASQAAAAPQSGNNTYTLPADASPSSNEDQRLTQLECLILSLQQEIMLLRSEKAELLKERTN